MDQASIEKGRKLLELLKKNQDPQNMKKLMEYLAEAEAQSKLESKVSRHRRDQDDIEGLKQSKQGYKANHQQWWSKLNLAYIDSDVEKGY